MNQAHTFVNDFANLFYRLFTPPEASYGHLPDIPSLYILQKV